MHKPHPPTITFQRWVNKFPVFYGWVILAAGALGLILTSPGQTYAVSIFIDHFIRELDVSRSLVSTLYTAATLLGSLSLPWVGRLIDEHGPRRMVVVIAVLFGLACVYMSAIQNWIMLGVGFVLIRMLGQGSLAIVSQNVINRWWMRRRGMVNGIKGVLFGVLGIGGIPNLINALIPTLGWRGTYVVLGGMVLLMAPLGWLLFRNAPEDHGLLPDGDPHAPAGSAGVEVREENWTLSQALRTPVFWVLSLGGASVAMLSTGLFFHMVSIFNDNGLPSAVAASVYVPIAVTTALVTLGGGLWLDRFSMRWMVAVALCLQALSLWMAQAIDSVALGWLYGVVLGSTSALFQAVSSVAWAKFFGRRFLGSIMGTVAMIGVAGSALGPMPFGIARDLMGSYSAILLVSTGIPLTLALLSLVFVKTPTRR